MRLWPSRPSWVIADVVEGDEMEPLIERLLANPDVDCIHVHNARQGCYLGRVGRTA